MCRGARGHTERARGTAGTAGPDHIRLITPHTHDAAHRPHVIYHRFDSVRQPRRPPPPHGAARSTHGPAAARRRRGSSTRYASSMCIGRGPIVALAEREIGIRCIHLRPRPAVGPSDRRRRPGGPPEVGAGPLSELSFRAHHTGLVAGRAYACSFVLVSPFPSGAISVFCAVLLPHRRTSTTACGRSRYQRTVTHLQIQQ